MSLPSESTLNWFQKFCINVVKCGPVPKHVAVILDGNRRYVKLNNLELGMGHEIGMQKAKLFNEWCFESGVKEVTLYVFSIENFKRTGEEVKILMDLIRSYFKELQDKKEEGNKQGICVRVIGKLDLLPRDIQKIIGEVVMESRNNTNFFVNVALAYTSREEITNAINSIASGVNSGSLEVEDIDEDLLTSCMYTNQSPDPDILIRTSGVTRFSDFLLWQTDDTQIYTEDVLWPDFRFWHFVGVVFKYQQNIRQVKTTKKVHSSRVKKFLKELEESRTALLENYKNFEIATQ